MPVWAWLTVGSEHGTSSIASEVVSIDETRLPPDLGRVPPGYRDTSASGVE